MKLTSSGLLARARQQTWHCHEAIWPPGGSERKVSLRGHQAPTGACPSPATASIGVDSAQAAGATPGRGKTLRLLKEPLELSLQNLSVREEFAASQPVARKSRAPSLCRWEFASHPHPQLPTPHPRPGSRFIYLSPSRAAPRQDRLLHPLSSF